MVGRVLLDPPSGRRASLTICRAGPFGPAITGDRNDNGNGGSFGPAVTTAVDRDEMVGRVLPDPPSRRRGENRKHEQTPIALVADTVWHAVGSDDEFSFHHGNFPPLEEEQSCSLDHKV